MDARPETITEDTVRLQYTYSDGSVHHLTVCPIRQDHLTGLLHETGFRQVERYGDFKAAYDHYDPDFIIQVATKKLRFSRRSNRSEPSRGAGGASLRYISDASTRDLAI